MTRHNRGSVRATWRAGCGEIRSRLAAAVFATTMTVSIATHGAELRVVVDGIHSDVGRVMVALHTPKPDVEFPDGAGAVAAQWRAARVGSIQFVFADLPPGRFAVAVYHDENGNDELDRNLIGIPKEGYAFSERARGFAGPPSFDAAAVELANDNAVASTAATLGY